MNFTAFYTLFRKEVRRFWKVGMQTISAPIISALLYQLIFSHVMKNRVDMMPNVSYTVFLIPGLVMMSMLQNAFANTSSSMIQSRITGNLIFILLTPITYFEFFCAYVGAAIVRGILVGLGVILVTIPFGLPMPAHPLWLLYFSFTACAVMGIFGLLAGVVAEKFDHLSMFQTFLIMPLTFLSGVFYSINSLPTIWQTISKFNPLFYMIDGFRYGFFGQSDISPYTSSIVIGVFCIILTIAMLWLLKTGYKLRK